jgi:hypothetical protein
MLLWLQIKPSVGKVVFADTRTSHSGNICSTIFRCPPYQSSAMELGR